MMDDLVTIIVPVYNVEKYLEDCLKSIMHQSHENLEIILVDDGSKDSSGQICDRYAELDARIVVYHKENGGLSSARNLGLMRAKGTWVAFVDSDDTIATTYVETLITGATTYDVDISAGAYKKIYDDSLGVSDVTPNNKEKEFVYLSRDNLMTAFLTRSFAPPPCCVLYNLNFLHEAGLTYDETVFFSEDQEFFWRVFNISKGAVFTKEEIYNYFVRKNSITTAPRIDKILSGYHGIQKVATQVNEKEEFKRFLVARWVLGTAHNTAKYCKRSFFKELCAMLDVRGNMKNLRYYGDAKTKISGLVLRVSVNLGYFIFNIL